MSRLVLTPEVWARVFRPAPVACRHVLDTKGTDLETVARRPTPPCSYRRTSLAPSPQLASTVSRSSRSPRRRVSASCMRVRQVEHRCAPASYGLRPEHVVELFEGSRLVARGRFTGIGTDDHEWHHR